MRFYTKQECKDWLSGLDRQLPDTETDLHKERVKYPLEPYRLYPLAHWMATSMTLRRPALLWLTEWGIWPSSENWHLYYKVRQSYRDSRLLHEAPGHYFLDYEVEDLATILQVAMLNGWGGYVLTAANYLNAFFSHDEYIDFFAGSDQLLADVRRELNEAKGDARDK